MYLVLDEGDEPTDRKSLFLGKDHSGKVKDIRFDAWRNVDELVN